MSERPISPSAVYSARPTVQIDQQSYAKVSELLIGMDVTEQEGGLSTLQLRLSNVASDPGGGASFAFEDGAIVTLGKSITVYAGPVSSPMKIFRGRITGLEAEFREEGPPELLVLAERRGITYALALVLPIVTTFFLAFGVMEDSGYLPRLAALSNRMFQSIGLNGKAVRPPSLPSDSRSDGDRSFSQILQPEKR